MYSETNIDGCYIRTARIDSKKSIWFRRIAKYTFIGGGVLLLVLLIQLVMTVQAAKVADYQLNHGVIPQHIQ